MENLPPLLDEPLVSRTSRQDRTTRIRDLIRNFRLEDLLTTRSHSRDFTFYRSDYLLVRIKLFALLFGIATPLWLPLDMHLLPAEHLAAMTWLRLGTGLLFLVLAFFGTRRRSLARSRLALFYLFALPALFYFASRAILGPVEMRGALVGYTFLPFILIGGGALFPLTLTEGLLVMTPVYVTVIGVTGFATETLSGNLFTLPFLGALWLMGLLSAIALWAQSAQLHMLLGLYR
ncbi:MAG TPA: hypothetical protein VKA48_11505, partial [Gammaproteobacteria bacterium]|nr:hypothetical protein [Gammaproteobacteria bacterium]